MPDLNPSTVKPNQWDRGGNNRRIFSQK
jgi:hypothetical protein